MPYKDKELGKQKHHEYYLANREHLIRGRVEYNKVYQRTPYGKFMVQRKDATRTRNVGWELTFDEWWKIWQDSGHWEERGSLGYHMCRKRDEGPYSVDNMYIAHHTQNKRDQWANGKTHKPPITRKVTEEQLLEIKNKLLDYSRGLAQKLATEYGLSIHYIYSLKYRAYE